MCDRQESRLYGQNFQGEIFATSVAISWGWKPPEKGRMTQKTVFGRKSVMVYIVSMQSRTGEGRGLPNRRAFSPWLRSDLFFVKTIALVGNPADAFQDCTHPAIGFQNPGHL